MAAITPEKLEFGFLSTHCSPDDVIKALETGIDKDSFQSEKAAEIWEYYVEKVISGQEFGAKDVNAIFDVTLDVGLSDKETWLKKLSEITVARKTKIVLSEEFQLLDSYPTQTVQNIIVRLGDISTITASKMSYYDKDVITRLEKYAEARNKISSGGSLGTFTGLKLLDEDLGLGIKKGEVLLVLGRHNIGKSGILVKLCTEGYLQNKRVLYLSPESPVEDVQFRFDVMMARKMGFNGFTLTDISHYKENKEYERFLKTLSEKERGDLLIRDSGDKGAFSVTDILAYTREFKPDILAIDGFHLIDTGEESWQSMQRASKAIKGLSLSMGLITYTVSQVQRDAVQAVDEIPDLGKSAYGMALEEAADKVIGVGSKRGDQLQRVWKLLKNRNGTVVMDRQYLIFDINNGIIEDFDVSNLDRVDI